MKSFQNKSAMTLVELIISVFVSSAVIVIVMTFMTMSLNELRITNEATRSIDSSFSLKDIINRYVKS
jgi:type II secretory pathway pseudopilin PulG